MTTYKSFLWVHLALLMTIGSVCYSQSLHFNYTDGTNASYNLADVRKITFDADLMNLHFLDGTVYAWNVSTIGYYQYDESSLNVQEWLNKVNAWEVVIFPNPTSTSLTIHLNLPQTDELSLGLYDTRGTLVFEKKLGIIKMGQHQEILDLTNITNGTYTCHIFGHHNTIIKPVIKQ